MVNQYLHPDGLQNPANPQHRCRDRSHTMDINPIWSTRRIERHSHRPVEGEFLCRYQICYLRGFSKSGLICSAS